MKRLIQVSRTDNNRLIDIRASSPYEQTTLCMLSGNPILQTFSKDISKYVLLHQIKECIEEYVKRVYEFIIFEKRGTLPLRNELRSIRYPCAPKDEVKICRAIFRELKSKTESRKAHEKFK